MTWEVIRPEIKILQADSGFYWELWNNGEPRLAEPQELSPRHGRGLHRMAPPGLRGDCRRSVQALRVDFQVAMRFYRRGDRWRKQSRWCAMCAGSPKPRP
jgi:hypothetical protein